ncbi:MAG: YceI family protein [Wenzhouxiangella sp.]|nr:YceI family protein [Wenzhouxiangella sp.]MCH8478515.1 YceI family protein [Wenzhouxiangella sp.]TVR98303.1 MAG: YceI family protein [Wenzhouxiangellaceae bacterium]
MAKQGLIAFLIVSLALAIVSTANANEQCYRGNADSGELEFRGVAEGSRFTGRFRNFEVRLCLDDQHPETASIEVTVETGSATVGNRQGDTALADEDLFAVERFPEAIWISSSIEAQDEGFLAAGELSLRGVSASQPVQLQFEFAEGRLNLTGSADILRLEYGVGQGEFDDPDFIRDRVDLSFELVLSAE